jgi:putative ATP-binding cassette transporter
MAKTASEQTALLPEPRWMSWDFAREALTLGRVFWNAPSRHILVGTWAALVIVIAATAYGQIALNAWNQPFYDALARRDAGGFTHQLGVFAIIAGALLVLNVAQTWLDQMSRVELRRRLTRDLFAQWLAPRRAFLLAGAGDIGVNPDQRIHDDARHLCDLTTDLGVGLMQAALLLLCFIGVLWELSKGVTLHLWDMSLVIPGYMVWSALFYAGAASLASLLVGRPLVGLNAERYARESDLRFALVHVNENSEGVSIHRGEAEEEEKLKLTFDRLLSALRGLVRATTNLTWVTAGYGWFTIVAPIIVAAPAFFSGDLTLGGLLMSAGAFTQVQQSLRWFVDNAGSIADWRATLHRVFAFRFALLAVDRIGESARRIEFAASANERLILDELHVSLPGGSIGLSEGHVELARGARILVSGAARSGKTCLFRAIAGLWPWGSGRVEIPSSAHVMFMPKRPFIPDGDLRRILAYPGPADAFSDERLRAALMRLDLSYLAPDLHRAARWDQELAHEEQLGLAFARMLLNAPDCVVVDGAIDALSPERQKLVFDALAEELPSTSLLAIGGPRADGARYDRVLRLVFDPQGPRLSHLGEARAPA